MALIDQVKLFTDGGSRGNPGPGAIGILALDRDNAELGSEAECIGHCTNNQAEYRALIRGLDFVAQFTRHQVLCFSDSDLLVKQMTGVWRLKNARLRELFHEVKDRERVFETVTYQHVPRTHQQIRRVDRLLNEAFEGR